MKKRYALVIGLVVLIATCFLIYGTTSSPQAILSDALKLKLPSAENISYQDDHGGFHGDGTAWAKAEFDETHGEELAQMLAEDDRWHDLPLPENLRLFLYGGQADGVTYTDAFAEQLGIPAIQNGCYYFVDRFNSTTDDSLLLDSPATNVTVAIFDKDEYILYYFVLDT